MCGCNQPVVVLDLTPVTTMLGEALERLTNLEARMTAVDTLLATISTKLGEIQTQLTDTSSDLAALIDSLGQLTPEQETAAAAILGQLSTIAGGVSAADTAIGDRDGSDTPPPADGGDAPADPPVDGE